VFEQALSNRPGLVLGPHVSVGGAYGHKKVTCTISFGVSPYFSPGVLREAVLCGINGLVTAIYTTQRGQPRADTV